MDGWHFYRIPVAKAVTARLPGLDQLDLMRQVEKRLMEVAKLVKPDILHAHSPVLNAIPALRVGKRLGLPVAYEVRAFWEDAAVDHGTTTERSLRYRLTRCMETHALKRADHVFTICEGLRNDILARGVPARKVTVIPNAVDIEAFTVGGEPDGGLKAHLGLHNAGSTEGVKSAMKAGLGVSLVLAASVQDELAAGTLHAARIADLPISKELQIVVPANTPSSSLAARFAGFLSMRPV